MPVSPTEAGSGLPGGRPELLDYYRLPRHRPGWVIAEDNDVFLILTREDLRLMISASDDTAIFQLSRAASSQHQARGSCVPFPQRRMDTGLFECSPSRQSLILILSMTRSEVTAMQNPGVFDKTQRKTAHWIEAVVRQFRHRTDVAA